MRRMVRVGMGLPRHDGEVEGVVAKKDAVLILASVTAQAMLKRISQNDDAIIVFHVCLNRFKIVQHYLQRRSLEVISPSLLP